ncbi:CHAT domain-containing protein [Algoriphagus sp. AGSA1]|uniref:CHAT domain-containing protein n=1 Tax=Algoriphagus sp. AGSA1 TaxID=2907213 RepID=UPI001F3B150F|nr:CHAT domain-containing protein [Algoriphagus sp. AGSA1]MCE7054698.1 CHAT domain-containing protein [Algoriphagus sp. AGSA1]
MLFQSKFHRASGLHYSGQQNYTKSRQEFEKALENSKLLASDGHVDYLKELFTEAYHDYANSGDWASSLQQALEGYQLIASQIGTADKADFVYDIAYLHDKNKDYHEAIRVYKKSISLYESLPPEELDVSSLALAYNNLGTMYAETGFFTQRKECYLKAKSLWESDPDVDKSYLITIYGNLMRQYRTYGDKAAAKELIESVNEQFDQWVSEESFGKSGFKATIKPQLMHHVNRHRINILYYDLADDGQSALAHLDSLNGFFQDLPRESQIQYSNYLISSILNTAAILDDYENSTEIQKKIQLLDMALQKSIRYDNYYYEMLSYADYCKFWLFSSNELDKALLALDKALQIGRNHDIREVNLLNLSLKKADILQQMDDFGQAEQIVKQAFSLLLAEEIDDVMVVNVQDFAERNSVYYINAVKEAANVYRNQFECTGERELGLISYHLFDVAALIFQDYYQKGAYNPSLNMTSGNIHEGLISLHLQLEKPDVDSLLIRVENNSSQLLWREFESKYQQYLAVPDSLLLKHNQLRYSLVQLQQQNVTSSQNEIRQLEAELQANEASISSYDTSYFDFFTGGINLELIQNQLSDDRAIVRYLATDTKLFAFVVSAEKTRVVDLGEKKTVLELMEAYHEQIQTIQSGAAALSRQLYELLVHPLNLEGESISKLVVIPDSKLNFLAFESLEKADKSGLLVEDYAISYSNSFKLWGLQQYANAGKSSSRAVAAFVPEYPKSFLNTVETIPVIRSRLTYLEGALSEAHYIVDRLGGEVFHRDQANKDEFLNAIGSFQVYHFATHAVMDKLNYESSGIFFQDGENMSYSELYNMRFPADLVVLSACNTGIGTLQAGEGMMSLSRALTYAGVKASIYSLWQVPDEETATLMRSFYDFLDKGSSKEEALAEAKRQFLVDHPMKRHPFYWAGFVLNGNVEGLSPAGKWILPGQYWAILGIAFLLLLAAGFFYRRRQAL